MTIGYSIIFFTFAVVNAPAFMTKIFITLFLLGSLPLSVLYAQPYLTIETPYTRLAALRLDLPKPSLPIANYVPYVKTGNMVFLSGHGFCGEAMPGDIGKLGADLDIHAGYEAAKRVGLCVLSSLEAAIGDLSKVRRIIRVHGLVNATPDFTEHPKVLNGFSDLMVAIFGENGKHTRVAQGAASLPKNMSVEVEMLVELHEN